AAHGTLLSAPGDRRAAKRRRRHAARFSVSKTKEVSTLSQADPRLSQQKNSSTGESNASDDYRIDSGGCRDGRERRARDGVRRRRAVPEFVLALRTTGLCQPV